MTHRGTADLPAARAAGLPTAPAAGSSAARPDGTPTAPPAEAPPATALPEPDSRTVAAVRTAVVAWYRTHARPLPWRDPQASPWSILVCEVMSQQTPVSRVLPRWRAWMERWPTPADLAAAPAAEVLVAWDSLGYPRRALRLQETAAAIADLHGNTVPTEETALRALPGVGDYTAAAVASFAHHRRTAVLDVNVRRVLGRAFAGVQHRPPAPTAAERRWAAALVPHVDHVEWNAGTMELGALVCTARTPDCGACPIAQHCAWLAAGRPIDPTAVRRGQAWAGTDRQLRGAIMRSLRAAHPGPALPVRLLTAPEAELTEKDAQARAALPDAVRKAVSAVRELDAGGARTTRLIADLVTDGLALRDDDGLRLP